jgi:hypothetical protein
MSNDLPELADPSTKDWGYVIADEEFPLAIDPIKVCQTHVRIIADSDSASFTKLRLELTTDADLFFLYEVEFTADEYAQVSEEQKLTLTFAELPGALAELARNVQTHSNGIFVNFVKTGDAPASLVFDQQLRFKKVEVLRFEFTPSPSTFVQELVQFRFDRIKQKAEDSQAELANLCAMLKIKNPSVLKQSQSPGK